MTTSSLTLDIVHFCARECQLQMSGERSVGWMVDALLYAQDQADHPITVDDVIIVGRLCEPHDNLYGFRRCGVQIGYELKMNWEVIPEQIDLLLEQQNVLSPEEFFRSYEQVHPFADGNGRSGVILFNWLKGTLDAPIWAPNFWNDQRRTIGDGA